MVTLIGHSQLVAPDGTSHEKVCVRKFIYLCPTVLDIGLVLESSFAPDGLSHGKFCVRKFIYLCPRVLDIGLVLEISNVFPPSLF